MPAAEATCTAEGKTDGSYCSLCGEIFKSQSIISKKDHTVEIDEAVPATCVSRGLTEGSHCSVCNKIISMQMDTPRKEHTEETIKGYDASCTENGLSDGAHCADCGAILYAQQKIYSTGHEWKDATCSAPKSCEKCGETEGDILECSIGKDGSCIYCGKNMLVDMRTRISAPLTGEDEEFRAWSANGGSLLCLNWYAINNSGKTIKYYKFTVKCYNTVGDLISTTTSSKITGPVAPGEMIGEDYSKGCYPSIYKSVGKVEVSEIQLEYMDGTIERGTYNYSCIAENRG